MMGMLGAYVRERVPIAVFGPAVTLLTLAAVWSAGRPGSLPAWLISGGLIALLVLQFRLWDDVEDRERDRDTHPDRLLVRSDAAPFKIWIGVFAVLAVLAGASAGGTATLVALLSLDAVAFAAYRRLRRLIAPVVWRFVLLLAKYPAFVVIAASAVGDLNVDRTATAAIVTYISACIYEAAHTRVAAAGVHP